MLIETFRHWRLKFFSYLCPLKQKQHPFMKDTILENPLEIKVVNEKLASWEMIPNTKNISKIQERLEDLGFTYKDLDYKIWNGIDVRSCKPNQASYITVLPDSKTYSFYTWRHAEFKWIDDIEFLQLTDRLGVGSVVMLKDGTSHCFLLSENTIVIWKKEIYMVGHSNTIYQTTKKGKDMVTCLRNGKEWIPIPFSEFKESVTEVVSY